MKRKHDRLVRTKQTAALVNACSISIEQAVRMALTSVGGTVVDAKLKEKDERVAWRIKLLTAEGRVKIYVDGRSGSILAAKREETLTVPDGLVIPEVVVPDHMQPLESAPL
jgi:uncharacterized membrane protein YkoI